MKNGIDLDERNGVTMVEVTAQVMEYDESVGGCGGWIPLDGGGMSLVTLQQVVTGMGRTLSGSLAPLNQSGRPATADSYPDGVENPARQQLISASAEVLVRCEYFILARRLDDRKILLHCTVCKNTTYRLMSPYLHTCAMGNKRFGLCFQSSYEACLFQKQFQKAIEHLYSQSKSSKKGSGESNLDADELEDEVFMPVDLPVSRDNSEMNATTKGVGYVRGHRCNGTQSTLVAETQFSPVGTSRDIPSTSVELYPGQGGNTYPYVIFQPEPLKPTSSAPLSAYGKPPAIPGSVRKFGSPPATSLPYTSYQHDTYNYPMLNDDRSMRGYSGSLQRPSNFVGQPRPTSYTGGRRETSPITAAPVGNPGIIVGNPGRYGSQAEKRESVGSLKLPSYVHPVPLPSHKSKTDIIERAQCFYCKIWFRRDQNERGSCPEAPDVCELWLQRLTCLWCANCAVYCCLREDGEGPAQRGSHVCACDSEDSNCCARWSIMGLLSLFVPCLWLYLPAKACHLCCRSCSMCGGRHKAM